MTEASSEYDAYLALSEEERMMQRLRNVGEILAVTGARPLTVEEHEDLVGSSGRGSMNSTPAQHTMIFHNSPMREAATGSFKSGNRPLKKTLKKKA